MPDLPVYIVDILGSAVSNANTQLHADPTSYFSVKDKNIRYIFGDRDEIDKQLQLLTNNPDGLGGKYPLIALAMPFPETIGEEYLKVNIERLIFATMTGREELFSTRYTSYFKPVLYPMYYKFFEQLSHYTVESDPNRIYRKKMDVPRIVPNATEGITNDFVDAIVVSDLSFLINPQKIC